MLCTIHPPAHTYSPCSSMAKCLRTPLWCAEVTLPTHLYSSSQRKGTYKSRKSHCGWTTHDLQKEGVAQVNSIQTQQLSYPWQELFTCVNKSWGEGKAKRLLPESVSITKPSLPSLSTDSPSSGPLPSTDVVSKECWDAVLFMEKKRIRLLPPPPGVTAPSSVLGTESLPKKKKR